MALRSLGWMLLLSLLGLIALFALLHYGQILNGWLLPLKSLSAGLVSGGMFCLLGAQISSTQPVSVPGPFRVNRWIRKTIKLLLPILLVLNILPFVFAYMATHVKNPGQLGLGIPRPMSPQTPSDRGLTFTTHRIPVEDTEWLETWLVNASGTESRGTVVLFPGNLGTKGSQLLGPTQTFFTLGYDSLLVDFRGVGGSSGDTTTIGIREAEDVAVALSHIQELNLKPPIVLYGVSMGSSAVMRAVAKLEIQPDGVILELPFLRLVDAVKARVRAAGWPATPTTELTLFWGGLQHGFNGFSHNPIEFAPALSLPTLVIHGAQDPWTSVEEIERLFEQIPGRKTLVISPDAAHQQLVGVDPPLWNLKVSEFLNSL